uniref:Uncharacterized protein n=1 Tax=viral metagenome TaxID=1070528 RepID=A0A6C0M0G3_9ZZZZ
MPQKDKIVYSPTGVRVDHGESTYVGFWKTVAYKHKRKFTLRERNGCMSTGMGQIVEIDGQVAHDVSDEWSTPRKHEDDLW